ncbi:MAG: LuxR C-terminal-related transcriptional regulator [Gemmatimonadaceae bacterium]
MDEDNGRGLRLLLAGTLLVMVVGGTVDLWLDAPGDWRSGHVLFEFAMLAFAMATAAFLWREWVRAERSVHDVQRALAERREERDAWKASARAALDGLGRAIDERFEAWGLTPTEREIALLLLKGRRHKEIAFDTERSERTVRQHAVSIYHKSRLAGRAELSAFFLEDMMLPVDTRSASHVEGLNATATDAAQ